MRAPIYRNLDTPFRILGMSPFELSTLCVFLVGGGELAQDIGIGRVWALAVTVFISAAFFAFRRTFGDLFASRLFRFCLLPSTLYAKVLAGGGRR